MKKINFNIAIEISSNSDEWCNLTKPLFELDRHGWYNDGSTHYYGKDFDKIALELEGKAIELAKTVTVEQLNQIAKEADANGWASIELYCEAFDDDDFFGAVIAVEALAEE